MKGLLFGLITGVLFSTSGDALPPPPTSQPVPEKTVEERVEQLEKVQRILIVKMLEQASARVEKSPSDYEVFGMTSDIASLKGDVISLEADVASLRLNSCNCKKKQPWE